MTDFAVLRQRMVDNQLRTSQVTDPDVVRAFLTVPREMFAAPSDRPFAYADRELAMSDAAPARRMMEPARLARLIHALPLGSDARAPDTKAPDTKAPDTKAMVVGCGSGYATAILSHIADRVVGLEEDAALAALARQNLQSLGITNVSVVEGKLTDGCPGEAPFDAILVDGAVEVVPDALIAQLKPEGVLATIERDERVSRAMLYERIGADATKRPRFDAWATLLPGFERPRAFVF